MTVQEWFEGDKITRAIIEEMSEETPYHAKAAGFVLDVWERDVDELTMSQSAWAGRILDDMVESRIKKQRKVWF